MAVVKSPKNSKNRILWIKKKSFLLNKQKNTYLSYAYKNILKRRKKFLKKLKKNLLKYPKDRVEGDMYIVKLDFSSRTFNFFNKVLPYNRRTTGYPYNKISVKRMEKKLYFSDNITYFL